ncbi:4680_t:CDS:1, partial [Gigaspora rosea]
DLALESFINSIVALVSLKLVHLFRGLKLDDVKETLSESDSSVGLYFTVRR